MVVVDLGNHGIELLDILIRPASVAEKDDPCGLRMGEAEEADMVGRIVIDEKGIGASP